MAATATVFETDTTSAFLSDLLGSIGMGIEKQITDLNLKTLTQIVSFIPLRDRMQLSHVSHQFRGAVKASITSLNFYRDCLDGLPDAQVKEMLHQYGDQITGLNFDLFKSTFAEETSQWVWRQTVLAFAGLCPNLTELSILICNRHRLRDKDLVTIFEKCPKLTKLCVDAQFLNGHCFKKAPVSLTHIEMEMCYRISDQSLRTMFGRFRKMKVLHVSQLLILTDAHISLMVRSFRNLQELSIVSHVDTKYEHLSGSGLAELGKLTKLRVLCLEGLGAVTDRTLTVISDPQTSPTASTLTSLSLAFCYNVSQHGLKHLGRATSLVDLNIDGITKRDVSMGVEKIAAEGRLARLFVAERTNISPEALVSVVQTCPNLRLLDISSNEECFNWVTADKMMYLWCNPAAGSPRRAPLTILTDEHLAWNIVNAPEPDEYGRPPVLVVHINKAAVPESELLPTNALSHVRPSELPAGLLAPHIRRGNRYRLLWAPLGPSKDIKVELFDENENGTSVAELALRAAQEAEESALERSSSSLDVADYSSSSVHSMDGVECIGNGLLFGAEHAPPAGALPWTAPGAIPAGNEENMPPSSARPSDFSFTPISAEGDPHTKDWSMDVISLLLKTYAYEDGAMVGPMSVREGIIMRPDGSVEDICSSVLHIDASLRARYHMTATLSGARRYGTHSYNARDAPRVAPADAAVEDYVTADIASAIDDFLGGYVPEDSAAERGHAAKQPHHHQHQDHHHHLRQQRQEHLNPEQQPMRDLREFPYEREMLAPVHPLRNAGNFFCSFPPPPLSECGGGKSPFEEDPFGGEQHEWENEEPAYYVSGGRVEGAGPKVAPMRYGTSGAHGGYQKQQSKEYGSLHQEKRPASSSFDRRDGQKAPRGGGAQPESLLAYNGAPGSGRNLYTKHQQPPSSYGQQQRGGLLSAPPAPLPTSFPFPPPAYLLDPVNAGVGPARPYGRIRGASASASMPAWLDPKPHPYQGASRPRPTARPLRPRN